LERKGRNGKEVTLVEQLGLGEEAMASWLGELKRSLGCGGTVEGAALLFQGDQRERLERALRARGVERISVG
jgi:translation initiation factor 1